MNGMTDAGEMRVPESFSEHRRKQLQILIGEHSAVLCVCLKNMDWTANRSG